MTRKLIPFFALAALMSHSGLTAADTDRLVLDGQTEDCALFRALNGQAVPSECLDSKGSPFEDFTQTQPVILQRVNFDFNSNRLTPAAQIDLARIAHIMSNPVSAREIYELGGYTDSIGNPAYNARLAQWRAESVRRYLITLGVPAMRLHAYGHGARNFLNPHHPNSPENRRVEVANRNKG